MENKTKIAIGCIFQWYEVEIHEEYINSVINAINYHKSKENILVDICVYLSENMEQIDKTQTTKEEIKSKFQKSEKLLLDNNIRYNINYYDSDIIYTIADYRRQFNDQYCNIVDVLMWGESDAIIPQQTFTILNGLHQNVKEKTAKYIAFFGMCKMWDNTWSELEHPLFADKEYMGGPENADKWWSAWYTMSEKEMNKINNESSEAEIQVASKHKTNGCGLIISSEVVKAGANIPRAIMITHEDTAFMRVTEKLLGNIPQYIIKNILLVHNRKHPQKRMYTLNENKNHRPDEKRENRDWYKKIWKFDTVNVGNLFNTEHKSFTWEDVMNPGFDIDLGEKNHIPNFVRNKDK